MLENCGVGAYPQSCEKTHDSSFCEKETGGGGKAATSYYFVFDRSSNDREPSVGRSRRLCQPP